MTHSAPQPERPRGPAYDLEPVRSIGPPLPGQVIVRESPEAVFDALAADLIVQSLSCVREFGDFHLALSGGATPQPLYEQLMYDPDCRRIPWRRTHLWIVDERRVPLDDERSNFGMIRETIVAHADIPREQVHPIDAMSEQADVEYERAIKGTLGWRERGQDVPDFVLLGMGGDGHTASLFPHTPSVRERSRLVVMSSAPVEPRERVTMTFPLINRARFIAVLVIGEKKAAMIERVAAARDSIDELPIRGVQPVQGVLKWYLDAAAAGER